MLEVRRVIWCAVAAAVFAAGLWAGIGAAGGEARGAAEAVRLTAGLDTRQEIPKPKGTPANARGSFVATLERTGAAGTLTWRLTFWRAERQGNCRPRASGLAWSGGAGLDRPLRALS